MKLGIVYYSMTGHSKKMAKAINEELNIDFKDIKTNPKLEYSDLLYIVSGIYGDKNSPELLEYVNKLNKKQVGKVAFIILSGRGTTKAVELREILEGKGITVIKDEFVCPGGFLIFGGHPNKEDKMKVIDFVERTSKNS